MTNSVNCGGVIIGGGAPVSIQSMTNVDTRDTKALVRQINELTDVGCEIVRCAIPDMMAAESFGAAKKLVKTPLVADIHFDYRLALAAIEKGADKIRINPGNIGNLENVRKVVCKAKEREIPIRVGVNSGSLAKELLAKYGGVTAAALAESGVQTLKIIEDMNYDQLVISIKSSNVKMNYDAHMLLKNMTNYPMHIGITESGTPRNGKIKSAIGIGSLLLDGVGDTIRVSLTDNPVEEVIFARKILETVGLREKLIDIVSCPTCGRTEINLISLANEAQDRLEKVANERQKLGLRPIKIAVMGCVVNGPGESREADYGIAGGRGEGLIFSHGEIIEKVPEDSLIDRLVEIVEQDR
ncbi:MAG: flavodoxin-dependent (E)-4-hydroxy-3-methylbut-2-enyl-diphosphate synthase [Clostridiales bacterium]|nr:flavodoxin-dependent (E)-4-hydroxy-3-methylbut-2-enyl-diphosphate synthase [Clostridiales bacterium]